MPPRRAAHPFAVSVLVACVLAGCSPKSPVVQSPVVQNNAPARRHMTQAQLGAEMQQSGTMSQKDYIRIDNLEAKTEKTHQMSDEDFAWTLSLLKTATNPIARARAMSALSDIYPMTSARDAQTRSAVGPYLTSKDPLDQSSAVMVYRSIERDGLRK